jgi:hypothetical protein
VHWGHLRSQLRSLGFLSLQKVDRKVGATHEGRYYGQKLHQNPNDPSTSQPRVFDI